MVKTKIKKIENSASLLLSDEIMKLLDLCIDDEVEMTITERKLIITPSNEKERKQKISDAIQDVFKHRKSAYQELAKGV